MENIVFLMLTIFLILSIESNLLVFDTSDVWHLTKTFLIGNSILVKFFKIIS